MYTLPSVAAGVVCLCCVGPRRIAAPRRRFGFGCIAHIYITMHSQGVALDAGELARLIYAFDYNEDGFISRQVPPRLRGKGDRRKQRDERLDAHKQTNKQTMAQSEQRRCDESINASKQAMRAQRTAVASTSNRAAPAAPTGRGGRRPADPFRC
jgi:hypothetical protein